MLINDTQALKLFGTFNNNRFSVAYQDVAVDGVDYSVGDEIFLEGLIGHLSNDALAGSKRACIEIAFTYIDNGINIVGFFNLSPSSFLDSSSATDLFINMRTPTIDIPSLALGGEPTVPFVCLLCFLNQTLQVMALHCLMTLNFVKLTSQEQWFFCSLVLLELA